MFEISLFIWDIHPFISSLEVVHPEDGIIHLVRMQNFPKNKNFLSIDTQPHVWVRNVNFLEDFRYVLNGYPYGQMNLKCKTNKWYLNCIKYQNQFVLFELNLKTEGPQR